MAFSLGGGADLRGGDLTTGSTSSGCSSAGPPGRDLAVVRADIERRLLRAKQEQAQTDFVTQLRSKADIRINEALVAQVVPRAPAGQAQETHR